MKKSGNARLLFVRGVIWFGILADFINALQYCFPESAMRVFGITEAPTPALRFVLMHAAALMAAWTMLLGWTVRKPIERRYVLLFTVPIALGIGGSMCYLASAGILPPASGAVVAGPAVTAALFLAAFITARTLSLQEKRPAGADGSPRSTV